MCGDLLYSFSACLKTVLYFNVQTSWGKGLNVLAAIKTFNRIIHNDFKIINLIHVMNGFLDKRAIKVDAGNFFISQRSENI